MNLFVCDTDPARIARSLADRHVVKMGTEAAQILCTVGRGAYRPTHANHPCTRWAAKTRDNAEWIRTYGLAICAEYTFRYGRVHKGQAVLEAVDLSGLPPGPRTPFVYVGRPEFHRELSIVESYRALLADKYAAWGKDARWTRRSRPAWLGPNLHDNRENLSMPTPRPTCTVPFEDAFAVLFAHRDEGLLVERVFHQDGEGTPPATLLSRPSLPETFGFWDAFRALSRGLDQMEGSSRMAALERAKAEWCAIHIQTLTAPDGVLVSGLGPIAVLARPKSLFLVLSWSESAEST